MGKQGHNYRAGARSDRERSKILSNSFFHRLQYVQNLHILYRRTLHLKPHAKLVALVYSTCLRNAVVVRKELD